MRNRSVVAFLVAAGATSTASAASVIALGKLVYDRTGDALDLGWLGLAEFAPAALLVLVTGSVADRHDRRRIVALAAASEAVAIGVLATLANDSDGGLGPIFTLVVALGICRAFMAPAARAIPSDIVDTADLPWLVARFSITWQIASIVGPVLGGFAYAVDPVAPFLLVAALLGLGSGAILFVDPSHTRRHHDELTPPSLHDAFEGLRFIRQRPVLLGAISLDLFAVLFGGAVALLPAIADERLGVGAVGLGWLRAAVGIGAGVATAVLSMRPLQRAIGRTLLRTVAVFGFFTIVLGLTTNYVVAFIALALLSGADAVSVYIRATLVPLATPPDRRGRVLAVENVFIGASNELGAFESGVAAKLVGTTGAVVSGGVATLAIAIVWWFAFPALRNLDGFPDPVAETVGGTG